MIINTCLVQIIYKGYGTFRRKDVSPKDWAELFIMQADFSVKCPFGEMAFGEMSGYHLRLFKIRVILTDLFIIIMV
jgi:hypothetical protein